MTLQLSAPAADGDVPFGDDTGVLEGLLAGLEMPPLQTPSEWAAENFVLSSGNAEPGKFNPKRAMYQVGMMDAIAETGVREITFKTSAQVGKTSVLLIIIGYAADRAPGPMLGVWPTDLSAEAFSKERLEPAIEDVPRMAKVFPPKKSRGSGNTIFHKQFPGGFIALVGANSPTKLRQRAIKYAFLDEVDAYDGAATGEGDPVNLVKKRQTTFWDRKMLKASTPLKKHRSRISRSYEESDQRKFMVPCPECSHHQVLEWKVKNGSQNGWKPLNITWTPGRPDTARYVCEECGSLLDDLQLKKAVRLGYWKAHAPFNGHAGFWMWELYSPWSSLQAVVAEYEATKGFADRLETFVNTTLGLEWEGEVLGAIEVVKLLGRLEEFPPYVMPARSGVLTAAVDVQHDRLELQVIAWGVDHERWLLSHEQILGDPNGPRVWGQLEEQLLRLYTHPVHGHQLQIEAVACDSGGWHTQKVYDFCAFNLLMGRYWWPIKGVAGTGKPIWQRSEVSVRKGVKLFLVGVDDGKASVYASLYRDEPGPNYFHLPTAFHPDRLPGKDNETVRASLERLTAEKLVVTSDDKGFEKREWEKPSGARNEELDCFDAETEVLTNSGWRRFADLDRTEALATVNLDTDAIEYQRPLAYIERDFVGQMVRFSGKRLDALVTPTHRMLVHRVLKKRWTPRAEFMEAAAVRAYHGLKVTAGWAGAVAPVTLPAFKRFAPEVSIDRGDLAELTGWYVAEGSTYRYEHATQPGSIKTRVSIAQRPGAKADHIAGLLACLPWRWRYDSGMAFVCTSQQLAMFLADCGKGCANKRVPQWVKDSAPEVIRRFLDAMVAGDGWTEANGHRTICTTSRQLSDDLQELFLKVGSYSVARIRKAESMAVGWMRGSRVQAQLDQHHVSEIRTERAFLYGPERKPLVGREFYAGKVYCATVPNGTLIVRRNGRTLITGNCAVYNLAARSSINVDMDQRMAELTSPPEAEIDPAEVARMFK